MSGQIVEDLFFLFCLASMKLQRPIGGTVTRNHNFREMLAFQQAVLH